MLNKEKVNFFELLYVSYKLRFCSAGELVINLSVPLLFVRGLFFGIYFLSSFNWPSMAHTSPTERFWTKVMQ